jgi:glycine cleavage system regulatory protein
MMGVICLPTFNLVFLTLSYLHLCRPGMLASISETLVDSGLTIENITTELQRKKGAEEKVFVVTADCIATKRMEADDLHQMTTDLESLKEELGLDRVDIRVQRLKKD